MPHAKLLAPLFVALAAAGFRAHQDEKVVLKREVKTPTTYRYKTTHAEFYKVDGEPKLDLTRHGETVWDVTLRPGADAGVIELADLKYVTAGTVTRRGDDKNPRDSHSVNNLAVARTDGRKTLLTHERVVDAPASPPLGEDWFSMTLDPAERAASACSASASRAANHARMSLAFPPLPSEPLAKDSRHDADYVAGYFGNEGQVQVFYTSTLKSADAKTATLQQSGKPKLVFFEKPASRPAKPVTVKLDEEKSYYSATVVVTRADGSVESREGEFLAVLSVAVGDEPAKIVSAKVWTKVERVKP